MLPHDLLRPPGLRRRTLIMGILNITPDSFYDGGRIADAPAALTRARAMAAEGADILDVGGESSRPGAAPVAVDEECARVEPVVAALADLGVPVSVDTFHAETARRALALGATMVNDISALRGDPAMAEVVAEAGCDCVLMHMLGNPRTMQADPHYDDVVDDIRAFLEERIEFATGRGIPEENLWIDPGFGFGKTPEHNLEILRRLDEFASLGRPLLLGTSNKSTIGHVLNLPVDQRLEGTAATVAIGIAGGADCVRVHDVKALARVARMADAIVYG